MENPRAQSPYARNLLRNYGALEGLNHWQTPSGDKEPEVEDVPEGIQPIATCVTLDGPVKNWVTSSQFGSLCQEIDLLKEGFPEDLLDKQRPPIYTSVRCAAREDCGSKFRFTVQLLDKNRKELDKWDTEKDLTDEANRGTWHPVEYTFRNYKPGVRYILVKMGGNDTVRWSGNYGAKFTLPTVRFVFNKV
ncbi:hypothetical protein BaRGS_00005892 [Batillaria attramentaria]|uniref:FBA domain-containing protein n=1 Tax=Batillaria attramentaria TaxID=370345 RepID=A0ABD0LU71_9CAEN